MKLADLDTFLYFPEDFTRSDVISKAKMVSPTEARSIDGENKTMIIAKFSDCETKLIVDRRTGHVRGACTCLDYDKGKPCMHIACLYEEFGKGAIEQKVAPTKKQRVFREEGKAEGSEGTAENSENSEDVDKVRDEKKEAYVRATKASQQTQELIAKKADELDEEQVVLFLTGAYDELSMVYEFVDSKGNIHTSVAWAGYTKAARLQGNIEVQFLRFEKTPDGRHMAVAIARDLKANVTEMGTASRLSKSRTSEDYKWEILSSKACRNALKKIIDPDILAKVIEHAKRVGSVKRVELREATTP